MADSRDVAPPPLPPPVVPTLEELVERYGADQILEANEGWIPETRQELMVLAARLDPESAF